MKGMIREPRHSSGTAEVLATQRAPALDMSAESKAVLDMSPYLFGGLRKENIFPSICEAVVKYGKPQREALPPYSHPTGLAALQPLPTG